MKLRILVFLLALFALAACDALPFVSGPTAPATESAITPTPQLDQPDGVGQVFLNAWTESDYAAMYELLSPNSQAAYTLDAFTNIYTSTATAMTLIDLEAVPLPDLSESAGTSAFFGFEVTYNTQVLGPIKLENQKMPLVLASGRWGIVWSPTLIFPDLVGGNTLKLDAEQPSRANIYDRNDLPFVTEDAKTYSINIVPGEVSASSEGQMLDVLSKVLRMTPAEIRNNYAGMPAGQAVALGDADAEMLDPYWRTLNRYSALGFVEKTERRYFDVLAPHVMGYVSQITAEQLADYRKLGYQGDEIVGQSGLEKWGEQYLAGTRGGTLNVYTSDGQFFQEVASRETQPAQNIYTTLDRNLQAMVQDIIQEAYDAGEATWAPTAGGASVVVMDVNTGAVLALASYPAFDPNVLDPLNNHPFYTGTYIQNLVDNPRNLFVNRVTQGEYPPGSIFKIVTMSTALGSGIFTPDTTYTCTGKWDELGPNNVLYDWKEDGHGTLTLRQALTASCDPYFYEIGLRTGEKDFNLLPTYAREYGFGKDLGIEIEENPGLIPDPDWLLKERGLVWEKGDSVNMAIGQGNVLVTPLQAVTMIAAVANGGMVYRPQFVDHVGLPDQTPTITFKPEVINKLSLSADNLAVIRESMHQVAADPILGTAEYRLGSLNDQIPIAGKTGTAQVSTPGAPPNAWFGGFFPYDKPELAIVVMIENGGNGSTVVAPIFRRIIERYRGLRELPWPEDWSDPEIFDFVKDNIGE
jgi:penicillin-binding protein 2